MQKKKFFIIFSMIILLLGLCPICIYAASNEKMSATVDKKYNVQFSKKDGKNWYISKKNTTKNYPLTGIKHLTFKSNQTFKNGYYFIDKYGKLKTFKAIRNLNTNTNNCLRVFKGEYYFEENGRIHVGAGWITYKGKKYYLSNLGKLYKNRWIDGHYLQSDGSMAVSTQTPDGYYVDCDGNKCKKSEIKLSPLKKALNTTISGLSGTWSVYVKDLKTGNTLTINNKEVYPASIIKLFVMEATYDAIKNKKLQKTAEIKKLLKYMITISDNESTNELIRRLGNNNFIKGTQNINKYLKTKGYTNTECRNVLQPSATYYINNGRSKTTVKDTGLILERIYKNQCVTSSYSKEMLNLLLNQTRRWKIPASLPAGIKVANKTGETSTTQNDSAIVFWEKTDYVVCIFSQTDESSGISGIKKISTQIYNYLN